VQTILEQNKTFGQRESQILEPTSVKVGHAQQESSLARSRCPAYQASCVPRLKMDVPLMFKAISPFEVKQNPRPFVRETSVKKILV